ncbi:hypothetical protein DM02DRAFT_662271 [Periconia macrospinosa]|uniref:Uncharacterized protein n=1 Tax=Periconia macrospinosa TaxID=97972 RepID=A0A2V1D527_9PLEO|nr:hypothetical protein DM02DRAFT_662271 [Periconia macrospinosa]
MSSDSNTNNHTAETEDQNKRIAEAFRQVQSDGSDFLNGSLEAREKLVASARSLLEAAENPVESLLWHINR